MSTMTSSYEALARERKAHLYAMVLSKAGIRAADATLGLEDPAVWKLARDLAVREYPEQISDRVPSLETRAMIVQYLTEMEQSRG